MAVNDNWELTLQRFRDLGGVAENVMLGEGDFGHGLFVIDHGLPVKLLIPNSLLMPVEWLQLDSHNNLELSESCDWALEAKQFYLDYQRDYGIGGSLMLKMMQQQSELYKLPESVKTMLLNFGVGNNVFEEPSPQVCLDIYKKSRRIFNAEYKHVLMPLVELVNHDERSKNAFLIGHQVGILGKFKDEILIHYGINGDATFMFEVYGFSVPKPYTFSGALAINLGYSKIKISRYIDLFYKIGKTNIPKIRAEGNEVNLSFLVLGSLNDKNSPKKIFTKLMHTVGMPANTASSVFDGIVEQNKNFFLHLLEELKPLEGSVVEGLRTMAKHQLLPLGVKVK